MFSFLRTTEGEMGLKYEFDDIAGVVAHFRALAQSANSRALEIGVQMSRSKSKSIPLRLSEAQLRSESVTWIQAANFLERAHIKSLEK
jgi:hypothetical protein